MTGIRTWMKSHPNLWEFILFNVLSNVATVVNFVVVWLCTGFVFRSNAAFSQAVPKYICLAVLLVIGSAALPAYSQSFFGKLGLPQAVTPTLANVVNIVVQVAVSYPAMKFWIMPGKT